MTDSPPLLRDDHPIFRACRDGDVAAARACLDEGVSVYAESANHFSLPLIACDKGRIEILKLLVEFGLDINHPFDQFDNPLLTRAIDARNREVIDWLLEAGADPNFRNQYQATPLSRAAGKADPALCVPLIEAGADVNALDFKGTAPIMVAAGANGPEVIELLISHGADVNHRNIVDTTPLIRASSKGSTEAAKCLLAHGADKTIKDNLRRTALDWAEKLGHGETCELLAD